MVEGRDVYRGDIAPAESRPEAERPSTDFEASQRARYLAKAASLGHVVLDDDASAAER